MSLAYADALTFREDLGGQLGDPERFESRDSWKKKADVLAEAILASSSSSTSGSGVVVFTGAGISVSSGIPDFRGPDGVWTRQKQGRPPPTLRRGVSFATAKPSLTHLALAFLVANNVVTRVVSQNVDGIHLRSGIPREYLSELHGNVFLEDCARCGELYERDFETGTVGFKNTGRRCGKCGKNGSGAGGRLRDTVLDWESPLPERELALAEKDASGAAVSLCLGTSLQIRPANSIPEKTVRRRRRTSGTLLPGTLAIVNLQETPKDHLATSVVRARCDEVMARVLARCLGSGERLPVWRREDRARVFFELVPASKSKSKPETKKKEKNSAATLIVGVESVHSGGDGETGFPLPMVSGVGVALVPFASSPSDEKQEEEEEDAAKNRARERAAHRALRAAAISEEDDGEGDEGDDDDGVIYLDRGGGGSGGRPRFAAVLPGGGGPEKASTTTSTTTTASGSAATGTPPFSARMELSGDTESVAVAVSLGLGLAADPLRKTLEATREDATAVFVVRRRSTAAKNDDDGDGDDGKMNSSVVLRFVTQEVDCNGPIDEERREIDAEKGEKKREPEDDDDEGRTNKRAKRPSPLET